MCTLDVAVITLVCMCARLDEGNRDSFITLKRASGGMGVKLDSKSYYARAWL